MDLADLDLENVEALLEKQPSQPGMHSSRRAQIDGEPNMQGGYDHEERDRSERKKKKKSKYSRSRSRSHRKKSKKHKSRHSGSRDKDRYERRRSKTRETSEERKKQEEMLQIQNMTEEELRQKAHREQLEATQQELKNLEEKFLVAQKEADEAKREDMTVMIYCLPAKSKEKEVYQFLTHYNIGKVRDIRLIKDQRTGKSKGVAYVEFFDQASVQKTLTLHCKPFVLNGKEVPYSEVKIQHSQAEKNRAAAAARQIKLAKEKAMKEQMDILNKAPQRIYIGGLIDNLSDITDGDLKTFFEPFGYIESVDVHRDPQTQRCKGFAYITYLKQEDARAAIEKMNNFSINGRQIKVCSIETQVQPGMPMLQLTTQQILAAQQAQVAQEQEGQTKEQDVNNGELDEEYGGNFLHSSQSRLMLMQKLNRDNAVPGGQSNAMNLLNPNNLTDISSNPLLQNPLLQGVPGLPKPQDNSLGHPPMHPIQTNYLFIGNMFNGTEVNEEPTFFVDLQEDVQEECGTYGQIYKVFVDSNSKGNIFVEFADMGCAQKCQQVMSTRYYNNQKIISYFVTKTVFDENVSKM